MERADQEGLLLSSGCEQGQGKLFSAPISGSDLESLRQRVDDVLVRLAETDALGALGCATSLFVRRQSMMR